MTPSPAPGGQVISGPVVPVPLEPLLARVLKSFEEAAGSRGMHLSLLPTPAIVGSDPLLLECIVHALVAHCVKHPDSVSVAVSARTRGDDVELQVWNSRPTRPRASSLLPSADPLPPDADDRPAHLDLQLARDCARRLKHPLVVRERRGAGVRLSVRLPDAARAAQDPLASLHVLLATDTEPSRRTWEEALGRWGCTVRQPPGAHHEAREPAADEGRLDLIVCDTMRDVQEAIDRIELLRRCAGADLPAILLSPDTSLEGSRRIRRAGIRHLRKPVAPQRLEALIRRLLAERDA